MEKTNRQGDRPPGSPEALPPEAVAHYHAGREGGRLFQGSGRLELARTRELLLRYLPPAPAVVLDVGGGTGVYALWLSRLGYRVHLIDAMPLHVEQARRDGETQPDHPLASAEVGDARRLGFPDRSADAVLLLGPLYHLTEREDRVAALAEARRVLGDGGVALRRRDLALRLDLQRALRGPVRGSGFLRRRRAGSVRRAAP